MNTSCSSFHRFLAVWFAFALADVTATAQIPESVIAVAQDAEEIGSAFNKVVSVLDILSSNQKSISNADLLTKLRKLEEELNDLVRQELWIVKEIDRENRLGTALASISTPYI